MLSNSLRINDKDIVGDMNSDSSGQEDEEAAEIQQKKKLKKKKAK